MKDSLDNEDTCRESEKRIDELETPIEVKDQSIQISERHLIKILSRTHSFIITNYRVLALFISSTLR